MVVSGRAVAVVVALMVSAQNITAQVNAHASAPARQVRIDRIALGGAGRTIEVSATDSDGVIVAVTGGKYPLVAESSAEAARATDSLTPPAKRCIIESGMTPIAYSRPNGYARPASISTT